MKQLVQQVKKIKKVDSKDSILTGISSDIFHKRYNKITSAVKSEFLELIVNQNCSIKKAAEILNINYSSAKSIVSGFRKDNQKSFKVKQPRNCLYSGFREIGCIESEIKILSFCSSVGGNTVSQKEMESRCIPLKKHKIYHIITPQMNQ